MVQWIRIIGIIKEPPASIKKWKCKWKKGMEILENSFSLIEFFLRWTFWLFEFPAQKKIFTTLKYNFLMGYITDQSKISPKRSQYTLQANVFMKSIRISTNKIIIRHNLKFFIIVHDHKTLPNIILEPNNNKKKTQ